MATGDYYYTTTTATDTWAGGNAVDLTGYAKAVWITPHLSEERKEEKRMRTLFEVIIVDSEKDTIVFDAKMIAADEDIDRPWEMPNGNANTPVS